MLYRHPNGARLALTSGHVTFVGSDWQELAPRFHDEAVRAGCQFDQQIVAPPPPAPPGAPSPDAVTVLDDEKVLRAALIRMVERSAEDDFTAAGMPNLNTLRKEAGINFDRELAYRVFHALKQEAGVETSSEPDTTA